MFTAAYSRRSFLRVTGASAALLANPSGFANSRLSADEPAQSDAEPESSGFKISLAQWSLHRTLHGGKMKNIDFPQTAKEEFEIDAVEYVNQFFKDKAKDKKYLSELNSRCNDLGVKQLLIMVDGEGQLGASDKTKRRQAVEQHFKWVEAARFLGCHSIRVNAGSSGDYDEQFKLASDGLRQLAEFAQPHETNVIVENHGGLSSNGQWLARVIRNVNMANCGTLPDFGNFEIGKGKQYDRYLGVAALMPFAKAVSAKSHDFDDDGNEKHTDYTKMMQIVLDAGYHGYVGIEYEGNGVSEIEGIKLTKTLLERCRDKLSKG